MTILFNNIPSDLRVPLAFIEFDSSRAVSGISSTSKKILVLGQMLATGTATAGELVRVTSKSQAETLFGRGSQLSLMFNVIKDNNAYTETWAVPLEDAAAGVPAAGSIAFSGTVTADGTLALYISGRKVAVAIESGDANADIATATAAAINAITDLPVTAAVNGTIDTQVDITCRWDGETGNDIDIRTNYYSGEVTPTGLTVTITAMADGATNPDITSAITAMADEWWNYIINPFTDSTNMGLLEDELDDRWGPMRQIDGGAYIAYRGTLANTSTYGNSRNSKHVSAMGTNTSPVPAYLWAAAYGAVAAYYLNIDPARPLKTLELKDILPPAISARWTAEERNTLLYDGISTFTDSDGSVFIEMAITMYQTNPSGVADEAFLKVNTPATLSYLRYSTRSRITTKYPRHKLADDGTQYGAGQAIVTPSVIRAEIIALAMEDWIPKGLIEDLDQLKSELVVERNTDNRNRLDALIPPNLVNQFDIFAAQIQFIL